MPENAVASCRERFLQRPVAGRLPVFVHAAAMVLFAAFCGRLLFSTMIQQGLPGQPQFWTFWILLGVFLLAGGLVPRAGLIVFLSCFPALCAAQELRWIPVGNLAPVCFSAFFLGWLLHSAVLWKDRTPAGDFVGFGVNCLALALLVSSLFSLLHPSASNSFSVAFSISSWPEKTEFNALTMGLNATAGCMLFGMMRRLLPPSGRLLLGIVGFQLATICLFAIPELAFNVITHREVGRNLVTLPFGVIHNLGGPACLFAGFFTGLAASRIKQGRTAGWSLFASLAILLVVGASVSKGAWLAVLLLLILLLFWTKGWKAALLSLLALLLVGGILRVSLAGKHKQGSAAEHLDAVVSADQWARNGTLSERLEIWKKALAVIGHHPLGGIGIGSFSSLMEHFGSPEFTGSKIWSEYEHAERSLAIPDDQVTYNGFHCHNDLLEMAAGAGLLTLGLFLFLIASLVSKALQGSSADTADPVSGSAFALLCFLGFSMIDSRLLSFPDNLLFWQFAAFVPLLGFPETTRKYLEPAGKTVLLPLLAPVSVIACGSLLLLSGTLPANRTYGVWNWGLPSGDGGFLLAREAQFVIPPDENLTKLVFRMPGNSGHQEMAIKVAIDGREAAVARLGQEGELIVDVTAFRAPDHWTVVKIVADHWAGRGALGTPFGVKPYAFAMRKVRN